jgi:hypothetical protein
MDDDEQLQGWLTQLCGPGPKLTAPVASKVLWRILWRIQHSPRLWRDSHQDYELVLNDFLGWIHDHICEFKPGTGPVSEALLRWVNGHLRWRVHDLRAKGINPDPSLRRGEPPISLDSPVGDDQGNPTTQQSLIADPRFGHLTLLDQWIERLQAERQQRVGEQVRAYVQGDPHGVLRACHPKKSPDCHCQALVMGLHLNEPTTTLRAIAQRFGVNEQMLYAHWRKKCLPLLQVIALRSDPKVKAYLASSPDVAFGGCHAEGAVACNCLELSRRLVLSEVLLPLRAIAKALDVNESTLVAHWQTQCLPHLKRYRLHHTL